MYSAPARACKYIISDETLEINGKSKQRRENTLKIKGGEKINERRKQQIRMQGCSPEKIEKIANEMISALAEQNLSVAECKYIIKRMDCVLSNIEKHSPESKLCEIMYHLD